MWRLNTCGLTSSRSPTFPSGTGTSRRSSTFHWTYLDGRLLERQTRGEFHHTHEHERGDLAVNIARRARKLIAPSPPGQTEALRPLFEHATCMLNDAVAAFSTGDLEPVRSLKIRDRELATQSQELAGNITTRMSFELDDRVARYLELIFILRYLEQIGNLSTNLVDDAVLAYSRDAIPSLEEC